MISSSTIQPPPSGRSRRREESDRHITVLFLRVPINLLNPGGNHLATTIVAHMVNGRLEAAGLGVVEIGASGPLDDASFMFQVSGPLGLALQTIRESLQFALLPFATIGWLDKSEGVIREYHPQRGNLLELPLENPATRAAIVATLVQLRDRKAGLK